MCHPYPVLPTFPLALLLLWQAQAAPAPTPVPFDPHTAVQQALHRLDDSDNDHTRFTYIERQHTATLTPDGQKVYDDARTYEITWIDARPYFRLVKLQDQPLTDKEEKHEQKLYDEAIAKRKDLGEKKRWEMAGMQIAKSDIDIHAVLTPAYTLTEISQQPVGDDIIHLIEARLVPKAARKSSCPWRFQFWISEKNVMLDRYDADVPGDRTPSCQDARTIVSYTLVDGLPKMSRMSMRFYPYAPERAAAINDYLFTGYRRFSATVTMRSGAEVDDSSAETPQQSPPQQPTSSH